MVSLLVDHLAGEPEGGNVENNEPSLMEPIALN